MYSIKTLNYFILFFQVVNVQIPFLFKHLVDHLNDSSNLLNVASAEGTVLTGATGLVLACTSVVRDLL